MVIALIRQIDVLGEFCLQEGLAATTMIAQASGSINMGGMAQLECIFSYACAVEFNEVLLDRFLAFFHACRNVFRYRTRSRAEHNSLLFSELLRRYIYVRLLTIVKRRKFPRHRSSPSLCVDFRSVSVA